jgi:hypothetical protein
MLIKPKSNNGGTHRAGNRENRVEVRIKRDYNGILPECEPKNLLIGGR